MVKTKLWLLRSFSLQSLGLIASEMGWIGPKMLQKSLGAISLKWAHSRIGVRAPEREATYRKIYIISKPQMLAFQRNWNRLIWTSVAQVMVVWVRRGRNWQLYGSFISSWVLPLCMLFSSLIPSNTCLMNLKSLNKHIKVSNGIKVDWILLF